MEDNLFFPKSPEEMFPPQKVAEGEFRSWKDNLVTQEFLREVFRRLYNTNMMALSQSKTIEQFHERRGEANAYNGLLEWFGIIEAKAAMPEPEKVE